METYVRIVAKEERLKLYWKLVSDSEYHLFGRWKDGDQYIVVREPAQIENHDHLVVLFSNNDTQIFYRLLIDRTATYNDSICWRLKQWLLEMHQDHGWQLEDITAFVFPMSSRGKIIPLLAGGV